MYPCRAGGRGICRSYCLAVPAAQPVIGICSGEGTSVRLFAESVARPMNARTDIVPFYAPPLRPNELRQGRGDSRAVREILGLKGHSSLDEAFAQAVGRVS